MTGIPLATDKAAFTQALTEQRYSDAHIVKYGPDPSSGNTTQVAILLFNSAARASECIRYKIMDNSHNPLTVSAVTKADLTF